MKAWRQLKNQDITRKLLAAAFTSPSKQADMLLKGPTRIRVGRMSKPQFTMKAAPSPLFFTLMQHAGLMPKRADGSAV